MSDKMNDVKNRDTCPFSLRSGEFRHCAEGISVGKFRDTALANRATLTEGSAEMRMESAEGCTRLNKVQTDTRTVEGTEIKQHGHAGTSRGGGRNE